MATADNFPVQSEIVVELDRTDDRSRVLVQEDYSASNVQQKESGSSKTWHDIFERIFWQGGSSWDGWLNASSFQVAQVLLTLPYSFAQTGMASGIGFQLAYGFMGCWASYMMASLYITYRAKKAKQNVKLENHTIQWYEILEDLLGPWWKAGGFFLNSTYTFFCATLQLIACASSVYYINDKLDKRTWTFIFGPFLLLTALIPNAHNYHFWSFIGIVMTTYVAWYLTIASAIHGKGPGVQHTAPKDMVSYFTGTTNILFAFGGHTLTIELVGAMWRPKRFKVVYLYAVLYVFTLTLPSAATVYWVFGDKLLEHTNPFAVLPDSKFRDAAVVLAIIHQFIVSGFCALPLYLICEKLLGVHHSKNYMLRCAARMPVCLVIWLTALMLPFFGSINSVVGSMGASLSVYILPCTAHMAVHRTATARRNAVEQPPISWVLVYCLNMGIVIWVLIVGTGFGGWSSTVNLSKQVHSFGLFAKCYQCLK